MKKILKNIFLLIICVVMAPLAVNAANSVDTNPSSSPACKGYNWCYNDFAVRFSLYKYTGGKLTYYNSKDYKTYYDYDYVYDEDGNRVKKDGKYVFDFGINIEKKSAIISYNSTTWKNSFGEKINVYGKVWYTKGGKSVSWSSSKYKLDTIINTNVLFPTLLDCPSWATKKGKYCDYDKSFIKKIESQFGIDVASPSGATVAKKINTFFGLSDHKVSESDLANLYITVEPTFLFFNKAGTYYYGTIYEILNLNYPGNKTYGIPAANAYEGGYFLGLNSKFYHDFMLTIIADKPTKTDINNFVSGETDAVVRAVVDGNLKLTNGYYDVLYDGDTYDANRLQNRKDFGRADEETANNGFGIGVFWIGDYIANCKSACSGTTGLELLKCAENYCEKGTDSSEKKKTCITKCGYEAPDPYTCASTTCPGESNLTCADKSKYSGANYCKTFNNGYYKATCTEANDILYNNSLPTVFGYGMNGLNYSLGLVGSMNCTLQFNTDLYTFEYAALKKDSRAGSAPAKALNAYNKILDSKKSVSEINYSNALDDLSLTIDGVKYSMKKIDGKVNSPTISKGLTTYKYYKVSGGKATEGSASTISYVSSGQAVYELPKTCLSLKEGDIISKCSKSELKNHENYYGYYNLIKENKKVDVVADVEKKSGCVDESNSCYYLVDGGTTEEVLCRDNGGKLYISNINMKSLQYYLGTGSWRPITDYPKFNTITGIAKIRYKTSSGETVEEPCSITSKTCKNTYKPNEYDKIREYCNNNYISDGYLSSSDCYADCSRTSKSCKAEVKCSDSTAVKNWCKVNGKDYDSLEQCVNDCSCSGGSEYIYRPIATGNAFPGRDAGSNWKGFEEIANKDTLSNEKPIYVIVLDKKAIDKIKTDNELKGKYAYKDFSNFSKVSVDADHKGLNLKSKFIKSNTSIFQCVNGSEVSGDGCDRLQGGGI